MIALTVHTLLYPEETWYVAHCLEFDLVAQGETPLAAFRNLLDAIEVQAGYAQETGDWGQLFVPAPAEYWRLLPAAEPYRPGANGWHLPAILSGVECALVRA
jgi:predicted RNase H-like HicB family nuclease